MINGVLLVNKESGGSSHSVVSRMRKLLNMKQIGHAGTLDPLADGLLPILIGSGTKLSDYILNKNKRYEVLAKLGMVTDTLDITGKVLSDNNSVNIDKEQLFSVINEMQGDITMPVPQFSAIKVNGQRLYKKARKKSAAKSEDHFEKQINEPEEATPMRVSNFYDVETLSYDKENKEVRVGLSCSKGSYIRSWTDELGKRLGCGATVKELRRTDCFPYSIKKSITLDEMEKFKKEMSSPLELENLLEMKAFETAFLPMESLLEDWGEITAEELDEGLLLNGQISHALSVKILQSNLTLTPGIKVLSPFDGKLLAILSRNEESQAIKIKRVFPR